MKARKCIEKARTGRWIRTVSLAVVAFIVFSYLYTRGISPVWAAVAIVNMVAIQKYNLRNSYEP